MYLKIGVNRNYKTHISKILSVEMVKKLKTHEMQNLKNPSKNENMRLSK